MKNEQKSKGDTGNSDIKKYKILKFFDNFQLHVWVQFGEKSTDLKKIFVRFDEKSTDWKKILIRFDKKSMDSSKSK